MKILKDGLLAAFLGLLFFLNNGKAQVIPAGSWHRASLEECNAEHERQLKEMAKLGWVGDPSIGMGLVIGLSSIDADTSWTYIADPCGYTNGKAFKDRYEISRRGIRCEITPEEKARLWRKGRWNSRVFAKLMQGCGKKWRQKAND